MLHSWRDSVQNFFVTKLDFRHRDQTIRNYGVEEWNRIPQAQVSQRVTVCTGQACNSANKRLCTHAPSTWYAIWVNVHLSILNTHGAYWRSWIGITRWLRAFKTSLGNLNSNWNHLTVLMPFKTTDAISSSITLIIMRHAFQADPWESRCQPHKSRSVESRHQIYRVQFTVYDLAPQHGVVRVRSSKPGTSLFHVYTRGVIRIGLSVQKTLAGTALTFLFCLITKSYFLTWTLTSLAQSRLANQPCIASTASTQAREDL